MPERRLRGGGFSAAGAELGLSKAAVSDHVRRLETSAPGVFACGDVRLSPVKRVAAAVGEGSMVITLILQYLANEGHAVGGHA